MWVPAVSRAHSLAQEAEKYDHVIVQWPTPSGVAPHPSWEKDQKVIWAGAGI